jgi:hypothetical protein
MSFVKNKYKTKGDFIKDGKIMAFKKEGFIR